jgi:hypothetical protein
MARLRVRRATDRESDLARLRAEAERLREHARATRALTEASRARARPDDAQRGDDLASRLARVKLDASIPVPAPPKAARPVTEDATGPRVAESSASSAGDAPAKPVSAVELLAKRRRERRD